MEGHIRTVATLHIALSILGFFGAIILSFFFSIIGNFVGCSEAEFVFHIIATSLSLFLFILSIPGFIAGLALYKYKEWARIVILIISALKLLSFPVGTAVGAYSIWVLVQRESIDLFNQTEDSTSTKQ